MLEAVEVEQREHVRLARVRGRHGRLEALAQRAPVAEPRECVRERLALRAREQALVLAQRQREPYEHEQQRQRGDVDGRRRERADMVVAERDRDGDQRRQRRDREHPPRPAPLDADDALRDAAGRLDPGGGRHEQRAERP